MTGVVLIFGCLAVCLHFKNEGKALGAQSECGSEGTDSAVSRLHRLRDSSSCLIGRILWKVQSSVLAFVFEGAWGKRVTKVPIALVSAWPSAEGGYYPTTVVLIARGTVKGMRGTLCAPQSLLDLK
jgi:hypothetical protein